MDPMNGRLIIPSITDTGIEIYHVFYIKSKKVVTFTGSKNDLMKIKYLKFTTAKSAKNWIKSIKK
jgi:hypothetical protein